MASDDLTKLKDKLIASDDANKTAIFFKALSDPTRIAIIHALQMRQWLCVSDIAEIMGMSMAAVSHHLCNMRLHHIVRIKKEGQRVYYALDDAHVAQVFALALSHIQE